LDLTEEIFSNKDKLFYHHFYPYLCRLFCRTFKNCRFPVLFIMLSDVCSKEVDELYQTPIVQQTAFWSRVKNQLGASTIAVTFKSKRKKLFQNAISDDYIHSDVLVILQQINRYDCIAYVPYGPEIEPDEENQGIFLEEMSESLRSFLPLSCILIRYDLCWES